MTTVKVSPKYQVVIPEAVRKKLRIRKGQRLSVLVQRDHVVLVPVRPLTDLLGRYPWMSHENLRDEKDREL
ncbi:MAG: AbrB/MazE/SpoVT family DNA-binding domain-containing protein [Planctomycetes bacterium]|nr:AbrB/MazE/SpoVT family DNA-binding domain-containing protein [Planctomycetota bacterium]